MEPRAQQVHKVIEVSRVLQVRMGRLVPWVALELLVLLDHQAPKAQRDQLDWRDNLVQPE